MLGTSVNSLDIYADGGAGGGRAGVYQGELFGSRFYCLKCALKKICHELSMCLCLAFFSADRDPSLKGLKVSIVSCYHRFSVVIEKMHRAAMF